LNGNGKQLNVNKIRPIRAEMLNVIIGVVLLPKMGTISNLGLPACQLPSLGASATFKIWIVN
jgi:hypothetical protein